jgi:hypothetical protein
VFDQRPRRATPQLSTANPAKAVEFLPLVKKGAWTAEGIVGGEAPGCLLSYHGDVDRSVMLSFKCGYKSVTVHLMRMSWKLKPEAPQTVAFPFRNGEAFRLGGAVSPSADSMITVNMPTVRGILDPLLRCDRAV